MASTEHQDFEAVALRHLDAVYGMARRLSADENEADDLVQETFMRAYRAFGRFELREYGAKPWLLKILHNVFYTRRGREHRQPTLLDDADFDHFAGELDAPALEALADGAVDWDQFDQELKESVNALAPEYRSVIVLWALEEMSYREIADVCDCPIGTVMSRLYRARQQLGQRLADYAAERKIATARFSR
jgi:RNA polymerase sigma-70 factor (ECF subfamily)